MRAPGRLVLAHLAILAATAQPPPRTPQPKVEKAMPLQLILAAPKLPFPAGGAMPLALSIRNTGGEAAEVPSPGFSSPFEFLILSADGSKTVALVSARGKELSKAKGLVPRLPVRMQSLDPGAAALYRNDLSLLLVSPLAPGKYQLEALFRFPDKTILRSNRVGFEVAAPRPVAIQAALEADGSSWITIDMIEESESALLLRKQSSPSSNPALESFKNLHKVAAQPPVTAVAIALNAEPAEDFYGHWTAWLAGGKIHAGIARAVDLKYPLGPLDPGVADPVLLPNGFQFTDAHSLFAVAGSNGLGLVSFPAGDELSPHISRLPFPVGTAPKWALLTGEELEPLELAFAWVTPDHNLWLARTSPAGDAITGDPAPVYAAPAVIAAWQLTPIVRVEDSPKFEFVLTPKELGDPFRLAQVDFREPANVTGRDLPRGAWKDAPVDHWILAGRYRANSPVLAVSAGRLWISRPDRETWEDAGAFSSEAQGISLWPADGGFTCSWFEPGAGYRFLTIA